MFTIVIGTPHQLINTLMKIIKRILFVLLTLVLLILVFAISVTQWEEHETAYLDIENHTEWQQTSWTITNVNIVPMTADTVLYNKTITITDGIITAIANDVVPVTTHVIDGQGKYLAPGLTDMHMHVWDKFELGLYVANGVTSVRNLLGMPMHLAIKHDIQDGSLLGPAFYTSSPQISGVDETDIIKTKVATPEEAVALMRSYKARGFDFVKTYNMLPKDIFDAVLTESQTLDLPVVAHPSFKVPYAYHYQKAIATVEHTEDIYQQPLAYTFDYAKLDTIVAGYAASGQSHCPTLTVFYNLTEIYNKGEALLQAENTKYINPFINEAAGDYEVHMARKANDSTATARINKQHQFHIETVKRLHKAGVNLVAGTDAGIVYTPAGFSLHKELELYTQAGMSNYEALLTATVNPGKVHPQYQQYGTVETGKVASFILANTNPLEDLATLQNPEWVMVNGRLLTNEDIVTLKKKAYHRNNYWASLVRVYKYILWDK